MLNRLPRHLPPWSEMLSDLGHPRPADLARALRVSERTIQRWCRDDQAPHCAGLAVFWVTRWGRDLADCEAHNLALLRADEAAIARADAARVRRELARVLAVADFGCANEPIIRAAVARPVRTR